MTDDEQRRLEAEQQEARKCLSDKIRTHGRDSALGAGLIEQLFQMQDRMVAGVLAGFADTLKGFRKKLDRACPMRAPMRRWGIAGAASLLIAIGLGVAGSVRQNVTQDAKITATAGAISRCSTEVVEVKAQTEENGKAITGLDKSLAILIALGKHTALKSGVSRAVVDSISRPAPVPESIPASPDTVGCLDSLPVEFDRMRGAVPKDTQAVVADKGE